MHYTPAVLIHKGARMDVGFRRGLRKGLRRDEKNHAITTTLKENKRESESHSSTNLRPSRIYVCVSIFVLWGIARKIVWKNHEEVARSHILKRRRRTTTTYDEATNIPGISVKCKDAPLHRRTPFPMPQSPMRVPVNQMTTKGRPPGHNHQ